MGNEDVVVCKHICGNQDAGVESPKQSQESMDFGKDKSTGEDDKRVDPVQVLPMEVIEEIFLYLKPKDLASCTAVSSSWREAVNSNKVWGILCEEKGWTDDFDTHFSHFYKAHKQFRRWCHSFDSFSPICQKRLLFNKHSCLQTNWRHGKYVVHKISKGQESCLQLFEPVSCDGKYLVMQEKSSKFSQTLTLGVWSLDGQPHQVCTLPLPSKVHSVESIAFDHETIAVAQAWVIIVYHLNDKTFEKVFEKQDLADLEPKTRLPKDMKRMSPHLKVTQDYIICVPNHSHSTVDFIPIFFWDRISGELKRTLNFDSMYYQISNAVWFKDSCYLSLTNKKKKSYPAFQLSSPRDNPYAVLVMGESKFSPVALCSGTLLSSYWVLTASHCTVINGITLKTCIIYGGGKSWQETTNPNVPLPTGAQSRGSLKIFRASQYDLALILVRIAFHITDFVRPIQISIEPWVDNEVRNCKVTGFGDVQIRESYPKLDLVRKSQTFQTSSPCKCHDSFREEIGLKNRKHFSCSLPKQDYGLCTGDSGSGLICNNRLQGVTTMIAKAKDIDSCDFSAIINDDSICGDKNTVDVFTLVYPHALWMNTTMESLCEYEISPPCRDRANIITESSHIILLIILVSLINSS